MIFLHVLGWVLVGVLCVIGVQKFECSSVNVGHLLLALLCGPALVIVIIISYALDIIAENQTLNKIVFDFRKGKNE